MKQKLLLALLALFMGTSSLFAQTDVTATYVVNPGFESCTVTTSNAAAGNNAAPVNIGGDWTQDKSAAWSSSAVVAYGGAGQVNGASAPSADNLGNGGYTLGVSVGWSGTVTYQSSTAITLPAGHYEMKVYGFNNLNGVTQFKSLCGFVPTSGSSYLSTKTSFAYATWEADVIVFDLTAATEGKFQIGGQAISGGSGSNAKVFFDNITLSYTDPLQAAKDALQAEIDKAKLCDAKEGLADAIAAAEAALASATTEQELADALAALQAADKDAVLRYENSLTDASATNGMETSFVVNGTFTDNVDGWSRTGGFQNSNRASNQSGDFTVPFWENWNPSAKENKMYQTINNIPNGTYKLKIAAFVNTLANPNESQYVFANDDKTCLTTGDPTFYEVWTVVSNNTVEIGLEQTTATANWMGIDNVSLTYYGAGDVISQAQAGAHKADWDAALAAAKSAVANNDYANVTGKEKADLETEIAKAEPTTADGYDEATVALTTATNAFIAAKPTYDLVAAAGTLSYADSEKKPVINNTTTAASLITALRSYYESHALAEGVEGADNMTDKITNANNPTNNDGWTWTGNKNNPASNESWTDADGTNNHSYFDGGDWGANSWTTTMKQTVSIPAGKYLLTAKARAAAGVTFTMAVGEASVNLPNVGNTGNVFDRGWGDASVEFETDGSGAEIVVTASSNTIHEWFSISNFRLVQLEAIEVPMADAADYADLAAAITAAEANTLGFDADEYAPYNNVAALQALAAAKAIDPEAEDGNTKEVVLNATTALTEATWTANTEEVNAVHNGLFATVQEGANYPEGWNRTNAWGQMQSGLEGDYATAYYNQPGSLKYGENGVYTMPLKKNTVYVLNFAYRSHENNSNNGVTVSVLNGEDGLSNKVFEGNGSTTEWKTGSVVFTTGAAGNYVLTLANSGNTWMTNVSIFRAQSVDITIKEGFTATTYSNENALDFSNTEGMTACIITDANGTEVEVSSVPAGTGVYVKGEPGTYKAYILGTSNTDVSENKLVGTGNTATQLKSNETTTYYVFGRQGDPKKEAFYKVKTDKATNVSANKAYLKIDVPASEAKDVITAGGGETDGINAVEAAETLNDDIYNLQGQKVNHTTRGIYIVNGKKIVIK